MVQLWFEITNSPAWAVLTSKETYIAPLIIFIVIMIFGFPFMEWKRWMRLKKGQPNNRKASK